MLLDLRGNPLHSRALSLTLSRRVDARLDARAVLVDLRKRGVVPVGGDLGTPGIVHHMQLDAVVDVRQRRLSEFSARQPVVAFESSALTGGESCRDPIVRLLELDGAAVDGEINRRLSAGLGGARGCSHILTLAQVLTAATAWVFDSGTVAFDHPDWRPGERLFRRDIALDGSRRDDGDLDLAAQLTDVSFAPAPVVARPMDRFAVLDEVRVHAPVTLDGISFGRLAAAKRRRTRATLEDLSWSDCSAHLSGMEGVSVFRGVSAALMAQLPGVEDRQLLDALLMVAPTFIQVCGAISDAWPAVAAAADSILGMGGMPDSCFMWRRGGAVDRLRGANDPIPTF